jgi:protein TonB
MSSSDAPLSTQPLDHQPGPAAPTAAERRGLALALVAAAVLHLAVPLGILGYYALWPPVAAPAEQEIPVEVVVEPPPQKEAKPKPPPMPDDERPAYDAPSAATQETANRESPDTKTEAPAAKAEPRQNPGAPEQSDTPPAAEKQKAQASPPPEETKPAPNADEPAAVTDAPSEADATPPAQDVAPKPAPPPAPKPPPTAPAGAPLPTAETLPQYKFAHAATESPIVGGNADTRYFTIVYGMIRSHLRAPSGPSAVPPSRGGAIVFAVDESGNLVQRKVVSPSGSPSLDMAVMTAIAEAAPYPAPPNWQPRAMRLTYGR